MTDSSHTLPGDEGCWKKIGVWRHSGDACERLQQHFHCHHCPVFSQMAKHVLGRPAPEDFSFETQDEVEVEETITEAQYINTFVVKLGDVLIGFPEGLISQVMGFSRIHSIPNRQSRTVKGIVNIDGDVKLCISLGRLLNIEISNTNKTTDAQRAIHERLVSIETTSGEWILPVSAVIGHQSLTTISDNKMQELQQPQYVSTVLISDDKPVLLIDAEALDKGLLDAVGGDYG